MPLYFDSSEPISTTDPTGSSDGSAAAMPVCAGTPDEVVIPLQYAVALNTRRSPGEGTAVISRRPPCRTEYFESSVFASYNDTKPPTAMTVTTPFRQNEPEMIMVWVPIVVLRMQIHRLNFCELPNLRANPKSVTRDR